VAPYKRNPMDFVLWKPSSGDQPGWDSPWGFGRPGWHIECSAMTKALFGARFDIHGGGLDLAFPHHENEKAQSCCQAGEDSFAQVWMHNEMLQVEGKKMSKSLGNFFSVRELLDQGYPGEVIRFVFLSTHYRKPMDWTEKKAQEAEATLRKWFKKTDGVEASPTLDPCVESALSDDLNTHLAMAEMGKLSSASLKTAMRILGLPDAEKAIWWREQGIVLDGVNVIADIRVTQPLDPVKGVLLHWENLRKQKCYVEADKLKADLEELGISLRVTKNGPEADVTRGFDPAKLEALK